MESRISRAADVSAAAIQSLTDGILKVADSQQNEAIDNALKSFGWASDDGIQSDVQQWSTAGESVLQGTGFTDAPLDYWTRAFETAGPSLSAFSDIAPAEQVLTNLRNSSLNFQQGVAAFMGSGIVEALSSLKLNPSGKGVTPAIPLPLDELLPPDKMKTADPAMLQASMSAVSQMFSTLRNMLNASLDLNVNRLRFIRA